MKTIIKICLWMLAFTPLIVDNKVLFSYTSGKNLFVEIGLILAGIILISNYFYSSDFRREIITKIKAFSKNPLVLAVLAFWGFVIISTTLAVDKYAAFWGNLSRADGLANETFFLTFFLFSLLVFEKKDWFWFFKLSLFTTLILLGKEFIEFFSQGVQRPGSFTGNPTFLAGYLLFSISAALIVLNEMKGKFFKYLSVFAVILSIVGIFITQTRGSLLGLFLGFLGVLIYCAIKGKGVNYKKYSLQKISVGLICLGFVFSGIFFFSRGSEVWQKIPGLARVAVIDTANTEDVSTSIRLSLYKSSLQAVNPVTNGWGKTLFGWGPENFILADSQYYNPDQYKYETSWYDRAHNKFLDVFVMTGLFGLLSYLLIWFLFLRYILKRGPISIINISLLFWGIAFLTHLIFFFDQITTTVPFVISLSFLAYLYNSSAIKEKSESSQDELSLNDKWILMTGTTIILSLSFLIFVFAKNTLPGYLQMRTYSSIKSSDLLKLEKEGDSVFLPFTTAQRDIRRDFFRTLLDASSTNKGLGGLFGQALNQAEDYISKKPKDLLFLSSLANFYSKSPIQKTTNYLNQEENNLRQLALFAPSRPDIMYVLAVNLFNQQKYSEALVGFERALDIYPEFYSKKTEGMYTKLVQYFYQEKDQESFVKVANRLKANKYTDSASLDKILDYLDKNKVWPNIAFE